MIGLTDRTTESLARLRQLFEADQYKTEGRPEPRERPPLTIAVSRQAGSRGAEIARLAGGLLSWPVYDHELLDRIAEEKGLSARMLESLDERDVSWLEEIVRSFGGKHSGREGAYLHGLLAVLKPLGKTGRCIIVGRGGAHVLPRETTLSVRVIAPRADRIAEVRRRDGLAAAEAERWVDEHDRERLRFVRYFGADAADPMAYDLVLNSARMGASECAALIVQAAYAFEGRLGAKPQ